MSAGSLELGRGIGWRPELADFIARAQGLGFVEVVAESLDPARGIPEALADLRARGVAVIPHGLKLSLGGAEPPEPERLAFLRAVAESLDSPLVSEHVAFVRGGGREAGHLLPVPRTRDSLETLVENVETAQAALGVPLALEHIAALLEWPDPELDEGSFLAELLERTGALLLLDLANLYANARNHGFDAAAFLDRLPLERIAYVHVGGGVERGGLYHDTHADPVQPGVLELIEQLAALAPRAPIMLERDDRFPSDDDLAAELSAIEAAQERGSARGLSGVGG